MNTPKVDRTVKLKKDEKEKQKEPEQKGEKPAAKKSDSDKFDLITIVSSVEMDIPEKEPPYADVLYDFIPESEQRVVANKDDHVSKNT
nr:hypothetical protein [Candidatus Sigynarchaeum springense]